MHKAPPERKQVRAHQGRGPTFPDGSDPTPMALRPGRLAPHVPLTAAIPRTDVRVRPTGPQAMPRFLSYYAALWRKLRLSDLRAGPLPTLTGASHREPFVRRH